MAADLACELNDPEVLALCVGAGRSASVPAGWLGLLVHADGRRELLAAEQSVRLARDDRLLLARASAIAIPVATSQTPASCGRPVCGRCTVLVRWLPRDDDLAALLRALPPAGRLTRAELSQLIEQAGATAAVAQFIREHPAAHLVHQDQAASLRNRLAERLAAALFRCGLELEGVADVSFVSEALAREEELQQQTATRLIEIESRAALEQAALTAARRRLEGLTEILNKLRAAAGEQNLRWRELLPALSPAERGRLLENLWRITPDQAVGWAIVVAAGQECIWLSPGDPDKPLHRVALPGDLGPLRCVRFCRLPTDQRPVLLVGAASGVWLLDAQTGQALRRYAVPDPGMPRTGFNAATIVGDRLLASHSQLGVWTWPLAQPDCAEPILRPTNGIPRAVRAITATGDGSAIFSADDRVLTWLPGQGLGQSEPAPGVIQCLAVADDVVYAGTADGELVCSPHQGGRWRCLYRVGAAFESVNPRRFMDLVELVIPAGPSGICGLYPEEGLLARLVETGVPVRRAWACDDLLVGLSELRDRLIVMTADQPLRSGREVNIARQTGRSIQDACIITRAPEESA